MNFLVPWSSVFEVTGIFKILSFNCRSCGKFVSPDTCSPILAKQTSISDRYETLLLGCKHAASSSFPQVAFSDLRCIHYLCVRCIFGRGARHLPVRERILAVICKANIVFFNDYLSNWRRRISRLLAEPLRTSPWGVGNMLLC